MKEKNIKQLITDNIVIVVLILLVVGFSIGNPTFLRQQMSSTCLDRCV